MALFIMFLLLQAFVDKFSRDLSLETQQFGVTVQCVLPGFVATNMSRFKPSLTVPSAKQFVRGHMNTLGLEVSSPGYWVHKIQVTKRHHVPYLVPRFSKNLLISFFPDRLVQYRLKIRSPHGGTCRLVRFVLDPNESRAS